MIPILRAPFALLFLCSLKSMQEGHLMLLRLPRASVDRLLKAYLLKVQWTRDRPRYDKSELREERRAVELGQARASDQVG